MAGMNPMMAQLLQALQAQGGMKMPAGPGTQAAAPSTVPTAPAPMGGLGGGMTGAPVSPAPMGGLGGGMTGAPVSPAPMGGLGQPLVAPVAGRAPVGGGSAQANPPAPSIHPLLAALLPHIMGAGSSNNQGGTPLQAMQGGMGGLGAPMGNPYGMYGSFYGGMTQPASGAAANPIAQRAGAMQTGPVTRGATAQ